MTLALGLKAGGVWGAHWLLAAGEALDVSSIWKGYFPEDSGDQEPGRSQGQPLISFFRPVFGTTLPSHRVQKGNAWSGGLPTSASHPSFPASSPDCGLNAAFLHTWSPPLPRLGLAEMSMPFLQISSPDASLATSSPVPRDLVRQGSFPSSDTDERQGTWPGCFSLP